MKSKVILILGSRSKSSLKEIKQMDKKDKITLLDSKIDLIDQLLGKVDYDLLRQWREETLMILDNLITTNSKYYQNFERLDYRSGVYTIGDSEGNDARDAEAYKEDLESARASLKAIKYGLENDLI